MKTFVCLGCKHIAFDQAPVDCPVCGAPIENYEEAPDILHRAQDPEHLTEVEETHLPRINLSNTCPVHDSGKCRVISVDVGNRPHTMESEHLIQFIDIYLDKRYLGRMSYTHLHLRPSFTFHIEAEKGNLRIISYCNKHGYWTKRIVLEE